MVTVCLFLFCDRILVMRWRVPLYIRHGLFANLPIHLNSMMTQNMHADCSASQNIAARRAFSNKTSIMKDHVIPGKTIRTHLNEIMIMGLGQYNPTWWSNDVRIEDLDGTVSTGSSIYIYMIEYIICDFNIRLTRICTLNTMLWTTIILLNKVFRLH